MLKIALCLALSRVSAFSPCVGSSADLPAKECNAWQEFFEATNGENWANWGSDGKLDPCSVKSKIGEPCNPPLAAQPYKLPRAKGEKPPPWQEPDAGVCCETINGQKHITQLAFGINGLEGEIVSVLHWF